MRRFRVAHVITRLCQGGAQENTFHSVRLASRDRFDADLISGPTAGEEGSIEPLAEAAGVPILREPHLLRRIAPAHDLRALASLTARFRDARYDIVHTHTSKAGYVGRLAARRAGVPIIVHTPHGNIFDGYFSGPVTRMFIAMERRAARWTDRLIELTASGVRDHLALGIGRPEQFRVIFSGVDFAPFEAALSLRDAMRAALGAAPGDELIGGVGRLETVKGFTYFVDAARLVLGQESRARFVLVGAGSLDAELRARAAGLGDRFSFLGLRRDVPDVMAALDVLAVPSLNEGMGRVILEAAAAGVPAVATDVGGIPDVVEHGRTGWIVPPCDAAALADALIALVHDAAQRQRLGRAAREKAVPAFSLENMVRQIETLYEELIHEKNLDRGG